MKQNFTTKLWNILSCNEFNQIISWDEEGKYIVIKDNQKLQDIVLPQYFRHKNFSSFRRQLNFYGFTPKPGEQQIPLYYYNEKFSKQNCKMEEIKKINNKMELLNLPVNMKAVQKEHNLQLKLAKELKGEQQIMEKQLQQCAENISRCTQIIQQLIKEYQFYLVKRSYANKRVALIIFTLVNAFFENNLKEKLVNLFCQAFQDEELDKEIDNFNSLLTPFSSFQSTPIPFNFLDQMGDIGLDNKKEKKMVKFMRKLFSMFCRQQDKSFKSFKSNNNI